MPTCRAAKKQCLHLKNKITCIPRQAFEGIEEFGELIPVSFIEDSSRITNKSPLIQFAVAKAIVPLWIWVVGDCEGQGTSRKTGHNKEEK